MQIYKCDICEQEIQKGQYSYVVKVEYKKFGFINAIKTKELCKNCYYNIFKT